MGMSTVTELCSLNTLYSFVDLKMCDLHLFLFFLLGLCSGETQEHCWISTCSQKIGREEISPRDHIGFVGR